VVSVASGVTLLAYTLLAFEKADLSGSAIPWFELSIVPFGLAILRYALRLDQGAGGAPEDVVLRDRTLQVLGAIWAALAAVGVYTS
jgi:decaprenyl-phosphate phosphoribosyltransferase